MGVIFLLVRGRCYVRRIFTPVMSAARVLEDNTPSMSRGRSSFFGSTPGDSLSDETDGDGLGCDVAESGRLKGFQDDGGRSDGEKHGLHPNLTILESGVHRYDWLHSTGESRGARREGTLQHDAGAAVP